MYRGSAAAVLQNDASKNVIQNSNTSLKERIGNYMQGLQ
jgi:hypothetical protein